MFCPRCGYRMESKEHVFGNGSVLSPFGCVRCNRTFLTCAPPVKMMDYRFKLGEGVLTWKEARKNPIMTVDEAKRRRDAWLGKRMRRRCVPRFCPQYGALLESLRERLEKGRPRTVYGCPSRRSCGLVYVQPEKHFMQLAEVGRDWAEYKRACVRQNRRLCRIGQ